VKKEIMPIKRNHDKHGNQKYWNDDREEGMKEQNKEDKKWLENYQKELRAAIQSIIDYPPNGSNRRTDDGYPLEVSYDEYAYKRMVDSYRSGLEELLVAVDEGFDKED